ncbi:MAG: hypothetical protein ACPGSN_04500 [Psychrobium sp.]
MQERVCYKKVQRKLNNMKKTKLALIISVLSLLGCKENTHSQSTENTNKLETQPQKDKETPIPEIQLKKAYKDTYLNQIVNINGKKFKSLNNKITTGTKLLDIQNSSIGRITGSFIVASNTKPIPHLLGLNFNDDARQVANNTWRFTANRGDDFLLLDKQLKTIFSKVELTIQYGNIDAEER